MMIENIGDHMAKACDCGSVKFNLLKSGAIECNGCQQKQPNLFWSFDDIKIELTDEQIKKMVDRFLGWKLPENFSPDCGISFQREVNVEYMAKQGKPPMICEPIGTNLLNAVQAKAMILHMLGD
jgi:hypothetical protein